MTTEELEAVEHGAMVEIPLMTGERLLFRRTVTHTTSGFVPVMGNAISAEALGDIAFGVAPLDAD